MSTGSSFSLEFQRTSQGPFTPKGLMQPNQTRKQTPDTLLCLLPDGTTLQRAQKAVKKAQGMTGVN